MTPLAGRSARRIGAWSLVLALGAFGTSAAFTADDTSTPSQAAVANAQRERIGVERSLTETRFREREQACRARFAVTACVDDARRDQRDTLARLRREESVLDDAERKRRAAERLADIEANQRREAAASAGAAASSQRTQRVMEPRIRVRPPKEAVPASAVSADERRAEEERNKAAFEERRAEAEAHRRHVEQRNAERALRNKKVQPLQAPGGAASAP